MHKMNYTVFFIVHVVFVNISLIAIKTMNTCVKLSVHIINSSSSTTNANTGQGDDDRPIL